VNIHIHTYHTSYHITGYHQRTGQLITLSFKKVASTLLPITLPNVTDFQNPFTEVIKDSNLKCIVKYLASL